MVFKVNFFGYSAHETTIAALAIAMNVWEDVPPFYASGEYKLHPYGLLSLWNL